MLSSFRPFERKIEFEMMCSSPPTIMLHALCLMIVRGDAEVSETSAYPNATGIFTSHRNMRYRELQSCKCVVLLACYSDNYRKFLYRDIARSTLIFASE